jgi:hypothetical protein
MLRNVAHAAAQVGRRHYVLRLAAAEVGGCACVHKLARAIFSGRKFGISDVVMDQAFLSSGGFCVGRAFLCHYFNGSVPQARGRPDPS